MVPAFRNPIATAEDGAEFPDPFVLRFNGTYYLYATGPRVPCWMSTDLVSWHPQPPVLGADEFPGLVPFAPEVHYAEGAFWMVTSPHGRGHFILRSDSPLGPFRAVTPNLGRAIDGHVFIDDDDRWYFYWAGWEGIWACEMASPTELGEPVLTGAHLDGWTEGPSVLKRDGRYFLALTGNHFLSPGYRVAIAVSDNPLTGFVNDQFNPALLNTEGPTVGLGHPSSVLGPDLVSSYLVYHSLRSDRLRELNLDRQVWSDGMQRVLGPSRLAPAPAGPDVECRWPGGASSWQGGRLTEADGWATLSPGAVRWQPELVPPYTLEATVRPSAQGTVTVALAGAGCGLSARFDPSGSLTLDGTAVATGRRYRHDTAHVISLAHDGRELTVRLDGKQLLRRNQAAGPVGLVITAAEGPVTLGYVAATRSSAGLADREAPLPVPGRHPASLSVDAEPGRPGAPVRLGEDALARFRVFAPRPGRYRVLLAGEALPSGGLSVASAGASIAFQVASATVAEGVLDLPEGLHEFSVHGTSGALTLIEVRDEVRFDGLSLARHSTPDNHKELLLAQAPLEFDLTADLEVDRSAQAGHADLLLRASQLALGFEGNDERLGADFLLGYSVQLHENLIRLVRHDYNATILAQWRGPLLPSARQQLAVRVRGGSITVSHNGSEVIRHEDPLPHLVGGVGTRTRDAKLHLWDLTVTPVAGVTSPRSPAARGR